MSDRELTLFLCGDVMCGRGIDQILAHPSAPQLYEPFVKCAGDYVALAERACGRIARPVPPEYIWGDALAELERMRPALRILNLETSVTTSEDAWPGKGIHYRMHPANLAALAAARPDCCVLANNHVLDWGYAGLRETLAALQGAGIATAGAGRDAAEAARPACLAGGEGGRVLVFAFAVESSGTPHAWAAEDERPGVAWLPDLAPGSAERVLGAVAARRRVGDIVIVSLHWGPNWGYDIPHRQRAFAHRLVEEGVDVVYGHSSHHPLGLEVHRERLILYGCGDFLNDYEGIGGHEHFRPELALMYFPTLEPHTGRLLRLRMRPMRIHRLSVRYAADEAADWLRARLTQESRAFGTRVEREDEELVLRRD